MSRKYGPLETSNIGSDEYDIIYAEGYASCLRDMIINLEKMLKTVEENDLDLEEYVLSLIETAKETLKNDGNGSNN